MHDFVARIVFAFSSLRLLEYGEGLAEKNIYRAADCRNSDLRRCDGNGE
jgi:hypothetical protein